MSFPNMTGPQGGTSWMGYPPHGHPTPSQPPQPDDSGLQVRHMGLKVQYTFEKDQQNCLAKYPHVLQIQTMPIDDRNSIGLVDLRICLQAIASCSPEIINQPDKDYAVYAFDYAEEDVPLVGQGMLSWGLEQLSPATEQKLVTGKVVKNMLAALRGGAPEILEVKLKLNPVPRIQRPQNSHNSEMRGSYGCNAPTPTPTDGIAEWSSFLQSNPNLGRPSTGHAMPSPGLLPVRYGSPMQALSPAPDTRSDMYMTHHGAPTPPTLHAAPVQPMATSSFPPVPSSQGPAPDDGTAPLKAEAPFHPARPQPAKRASSKAPKKRATTSSGKPVGRPRKHDRPETGNTSAIEDATDGEEAPVEGPKKKRAKTTKADYPTKAPLDSNSGSLRVTASTSGSLRSLRPAVAAMSNGVGASHLQEVPRAPTPVPGQQPRPRGRAPGQAQPRRSSMADLDGSSRVQISEMGKPGPLMQDARSPDSIAQSPFQAYTPEDSSADIGSSPPVPRSAHSIRSSPPPSSPVLPPMPMPPSQPDSGFMSGGLDDMADECNTHLPLPMPAQSPQMPQVPQMPQPANSVRTNPKKKSKSTKRKPKAPQLPRVFPRPLSSGLPEPPPAVPPRSVSLGIPEPSAQAPLEDAANGSTQPQQMLIQHEHPGPSELLPKQSLYKPSVSAMAQIKKSQATGTTKGAACQLKRANTEPNLQRQDKPVLPIGPPPVPQPPIEQDVVEPEAAVTESTEPEPIAPEVRQPELSKQPTTETPKKELVEEPQLPTQTAVESVEDPDDSLLRLLSEPLNLNQDIDPEPSPRPESQKSASTPAQPAKEEPIEEAIDPAHMPAPPAPPAGDPEVAAPGNSPSSASPEDATQPTKNMSRKQSIKDKLEKAIQAGQMPTFCANCGSISTPTWRKIWTQDHEGNPEDPKRASPEKAGCITAIFNLEEDENGIPTKYRVIKKALEPAEDKSKWTEDILCNPCGLWLSKYQTHRPESQWEKDYSQIGKPRKKRTTRTSRSKKAKTQGAALANLTSEAYLITDPIGPDDQGQTPLTEGGDEVMLLRGPTTEPPSRERGTRSQTAETGGLHDCLDRQGSTNSRGSGTAQSPVALVEDTLGNTKRLLFPSPKKNGQPKLLGDVAVNIVRTSAGAQASRSPVTGKENSVLAMDIDEMDLLSTSKGGGSGTDEDTMAGLFGTPLRSSTPPPKERPAGAFKTPTRPTPSHRPITRSVSKSIRTVRSVARSPGQLLPRMQGTPTKTPRSSGRLRSSGGANNQHLYAHFAADDGLVINTDFGTPFSSTINQLLSEANDFTAGSSAHGLYELPNLGSDHGLTGHFENLDFGHFLTTDAVVPSSPTVPRRSEDVETFESADMSFSDWENFEDVDMDGTGDCEDAQAK